MYKCFSIYLILFCIIFAFILFSFRVFFCCWVIFLFVFRYFLFLFVLHSLKILSFLRLTYFREQFFLFFTRILLIFMYISLSHVCMYLWKNVKKHEKIFWFLFIGYILNIHVIVSVYSRPGLYEKKIILHLNCENDWKGISKMKK